MRQSWEGLWACCFGQFPRGNPIPQGPRSQAAVEGHGGAAGGDTHSEAGTSSPGDALLSGCLTLGPQGSL